MGDEKKIESHGHKEGVSLSDNPDGTRHESKWYSNDHTSARTSRDIGSDGSESNKHTTDQRKK